jgi:hypothetical protein
VTRGVVREVLQVTDYTYLLLKTDQGTDIWAAVPKGELTPGASVEIAEDLRMKNFTGREAGRTFEEIIFGTLTR